MINLPSMSKPIIPVSIGIFTRLKSNEFELWMQRRFEEGQFLNFWEFPGGKIEAQETPEQGLCREVKEEVGTGYMDGAKVKLFKIYPYEYETKIIKLYVFLVKLLPEQEDRLPGPGQWQSWPYDTVLDFSSESMIPANVHLIQELSNKLRPFYERPTLLWDQPSSSSETP